MTYEKDEQLPDLSSQEFLALWCLSSLSSTEVPEFGNVGFLSGQCRFTKPIKIGRSFYNKGPSPYQLQMGCAQHDSDHLFKLDH